MAKSLFDEEKNNLRAQVKEERILEIQKRAEQRTNNIQDSHSEQDVHEQASKAEEDKQKTEKPNENSGQPANDASSSNEEEQANQLEQNDSLPKSDTSANESPQDEENESSLNRERQDPSNNRQQNGGKEQNDVDNHQEKVPKEPELLIPRFDSTQKYGSHSPAEKMGHLPNGTILPKGTTIIHDGITYTIKEKLGAGGFAIAYRAEYGRNMQCVIKEFHPRRTLRYSDYTLDYSGCAVDDIRKGQPKFEQEPDRIFTILEKGKGESKKVNDDMSFETAWETARKDIGTGGVFTHKGKVYTTYDDAELNSLNIALPISKCFRIGNGLYFIMEYVKGYSLEKYLHKTIDKERPINFELAMKIMEQLCEGVKNIHNIPCAHMDITPANIMFSTDNNQNVNLKIIDFGMATYTKDISVEAAGVSLNEKKSDEGSFVAGGTESFTDVKTRYDDYLSNEDTLKIGDKIKLIDIYALGCVLCYMTLINKKQNPDDTNISLANKIAEMHSIKMQGKYPSELIINDGDSILLQNQKRIYQACYDLVRKATSYDFSDRYPNAEEFLKELRKIQASVEWQNKAKVKEQNNEWAVPAEGGKVYLSFLHNYMCAAHLTPNDCSWVQLDKNLIKILGKDALLKNKIPGSLELTISQNNNTRKRTAAVTIICGKSKILATIVQNGKVVQKPDVHFTDATEHLSKLEAAGGKNIIKFSANAPWIAKVEEGAEKWLKLSDTAGQAGTHSIVMDVLPNTETTPRAAIVKIGCGEKEVEWFIEQQASIIEPPLFIHYENHTKPTTSVSAFGGQTTIEFSCNGVWHVDFDTPKAKEWVTCQMAGKAGYNQKVAIDVASNKDDSPRKAVMKISCGRESITYTIIQEKLVPPPPPGPGEKKNYKSTIIAILVGLIATAGAWILTNNILDGEDTSIDRKIDEISLKLPKGNQYEISHKGGSQIIQLESPGLWKAEIKEESPDKWLEIKEGSGKPGKGQFGLVANENRRYEPKKATIVISSGDKKILAHITQGIDRADSLNNEVIKTIKDPFSLVKFLKYVKPMITIYECYERNGEKHAMDIDLNTLLSKKNPEVIIGKTHDIIEFTEDSEDGRINSLVLLKK